MITNQLLKGATLPPLIEREIFDFESMAKTLKLLTNEVSDLKRKGIETSTTTKPPKPFFKKSNPNASKPPSNSNAALNVEEIAKDNFFSFHQAAHSEKMCPQWIGSMTAVVNQLLDDQTLGNQIEDDVSDQDEGSLLDGEPGASVLTFDIIRGGGKSFSH